MITTNGKEHSVKGGQPDARGKSCGAKRTVCCSTLLLFAFLIFNFSFSSPAESATNIIKNGGFEKEGANGNLFEGWSASMMGYMPRVFGRDALGQAIFHYICGCGFDLGLEKPFAGLMCANCGRVSVAEETGSWYDDNADFVKVGGGRRGKGCMFDIPLIVGQNEGVRIISDLVKIKRDWPYEVTVTFRTEGPTSVRVFVECYKVVDKEVSPGSYNFKKEVGEESGTDGAEGAEGADATEKPEAKEPGKAEAKIDAALGKAKAKAEAEAAKNPSGADPKAEKSTGPATAARPIEVEKTYRVNIPMGSSTGWSTVSRTFMAPPRYKTDYLQVKLYGYMAVMQSDGNGKAYFDDVIVRPLSLSEAKAWWAKEKPKKDKRFH